jgi:hypothetical protein
MEKNQNFKIRKTNFSYQHPTEGIGVLIMISMDHVEEILSLKYF